MIADFGCDFSEICNFTTDMNDIPENDYARIAAMIHSDSSPVGIDAKKTHIMLIYMVEQMQARLEKMEERLATLEVGE